MKLLTGFLLSTRCFSFASFFRCSLGFSLVYILTESLAQATCLVSCYLPPCQGIQLQWVGISILSLIIVGLASSFSQPTITYRAKLEGKWGVFTTNNNDDDDDNNNSYN